MDRYLLDSNYWINAENYYPIDIFPSFWERMKTLIESGEVVVHQTVLEEIDRKERAASDWLHAVAGDVIMPITEDTLAKYVDVCRWAEDQAQNYKKEAIDEFEQNDRADAWICAEASASELLIVTNEKKLNSPNKVKIPNVCEAFGIEYMANLDFMRKQGFSF